MLVTHIRFWYTYLPTVYGKYNTTLYKYCTHDRLPKLIIFTEPSGSVRPPLLSIA